MNGNDTNTFDAAIRTHHHAALERLSPRVRAQLAQRRNAALRGTAAASRGGHGLRYAAAGFAVLCALAIGLQVRTGPVPATMPATAGNTASTATGVATMLDEDPEFYAWLASSDAQRVAME